MLADNASQQRLDFAEMVVNDLETVLGPRNRNFIAKLISGTNRLDDQAVSRVATGIANGAKQIRDYLKHRYGLRSGQKLPTGLAQRIGTLGWLNEQDFPRLG